MLRIRCPYCGERDEVEFRYRGDASIPRPGGDDVALTAFVYERNNPCGWHLEWWLHVGGCRKLLKVSRHTISHEIRTVDGALP
jgi:heterotetrameric sarcosine oxidase delta subunit